MSDITAPGAKPNEDLHLLQGKAIGLIGVLFLTITGAAPITAMLLNVPVAVGNGVAFGAPAAFLVATVILLIFSVGYAAMASKVSAVGGFYSFISHGLGRELGLATGFASIVAYAVFEPALAGGFAYFANLKVLELTGVNVPWPVFALGMVAGIAILSYFDVKFSAAILGVALVAEVAILLVFDYGVFSHNGHGATVNLSSLNPIAAFQGFDAKDKLAAGAAGIGLFFAFWSWVGFEMAPNYAEESVNPKKIVPLSLYISVLSLGVFYTITSWAAVSVYPDFDSLITKAQTDAANLFLTSAAAFSGTWVSSTMSWLILTSSMACGMAFHNTASRYIYSLGREGVLPKALGRTHGVYKTPHIASFAQAGIAALVILSFMVFSGTNDPAAQAYVQLYGLMALLGTMLILAAQALVSVAIIVYFAKHHPEDHHWFETMLAPGFAFVAQVGVIALCLTNMDFLGGGIKFADYIIWINLGVIVLGLIAAFALKSLKPDVYDKIGRVLIDGVAD